MPKKILFVDDEKDVLEFATNFFRRRKIDVITASSGQEALGLYEKESPKLVLLDIKMDKMDGLETLKLLKEKDKDVRVIMVTGKKPEEDGSYERSKELGAQGYIHKPLKLEELEQTVLRLLKD